MKVTPSVLEVTSDPIFLQKCIIPYGLRESVSNECTSAYGNTVVHICKAF